MSTYVIADAVNWIFMAELYWFFPATAGNGLKLSGPEIWIPTDFDDRGGNIYPDQTDDKVQDIFRWYAAGIPSAQ